MDFDTIQNLASQYQNVLYIVGSGIVGATVGALYSKLRSNNSLEKKKLETQVALAEETTRQGEYTFQRQKALSDVELAKIEGATLETRHKHNLETRAIERGYALEDSDRDEALRQRTRQEKLHDEDLAHQRKQEEIRQEIENSAANQPGLELVRETLKPVVDSYNQSLVQYRQQVQQARVALIESRQEERTALFEEWKADNDLQDSNNIYDSTIPDFTGLVEAKFPDDIAERFPAPELPVSLKQVLGMK